MTFLQGLDTVGGEGSLGVWVTTCSLPLGPQCQQNISNVYSLLGQDGYEAVSNECLKKKELQKRSSSFMLPKGKRCGLPHQENVFAEGTASSAQSGPRIPGGKGPKPLPWTQSLILHQHVLTLTA